MSATLYDYWQDIYERKLLLLIVVISSALFGYLISLALPPLYEAKTTFYAPSNLSLPPIRDRKAPDILPRVPSFRRRMRKPPPWDIGILLSMDVYRTLGEKFPQRDVASLKRISTSPSAANSLIDIHVRDKDLAVGSGYRKRCRRSIVSSTSGFFASDWSTRLRR